jgi:hypothetical protein
VQKDQQRHKRDEYIIDEAHPGDFAAADVYPHERDLSRGYLSHRKITDKEGQHNNDPARRQIHPP